MTSSHHERDETAPRPIESRVRPQLVFDRASIQSVDRDAIERFGIPGAVLMENAARGLAEVVMSHLHSVAAPRVLICCGSGNNGGDGYAVARHLHNHGARPLLAALAEPRPGSDAAINAEICRRMALGRHDGGPESAGPVDLVVDALFGTGLDRPVRGAAAAWIEAINARTDPVVAVDVPSGLDCNSGLVLGCAIRADRTVTFVGLKEGFLTLEAQPYLGEVTVVDIGAPVELYTEHGRPLPDPVPDDRTQRRDGEPRTRHR